MVGLLMLWLGLAHAGVCETPAATAAYQEGYQALQARQTETAGAALSRCIELEPSCLLCRYELGWNHWARGEYGLAATRWEEVLKIQPDHVAAQWLPEARAKLSGEGGSVALPGRVSIGTGSRPTDGRIQMRVAARFQNYNAKPSVDLDRFDTDIYSPKSARFSADGGRVYVNSLEGFRTVVYDVATKTKRSIIAHEFDASDAALFGGRSTVFGYKYNRRSPSGDPNVFSGKPVESALSHDGKFLWVPYYRRDFDYGATSPSAVAIIDTTTDAVVRVLPTGPIPKYVAISPDGKMAAITHWGDNTVALVDLPSDDPSTFVYRPERLVVERILPQAGLAGKNRDGACGHCLRGTVFTPDSKTLLVARMGTGGIAGFDVATGDYLGTLTGERPSPRHLVIDGTGEWLYLSSNRSGYVSKIRLDTVMQGFANAGGKTLYIKGYQEARVGGGARTLQLSSDDKWIFVAVNGRSEVVALDAHTLREEARVAVDAYPVGLAVSPNGDEVWVTSQGKSGQGGNSVCVIEVQLADVNKKMD